ncbi:DUF1345 domain-containing protein [Kribbella italica]|uniref:Putative membrane protein n=1 Tax=Kribbella italica TaxID=1540520 RepID=A0A7W9J963_9ACTN|nr:DUF1345 domain-containing protein [Kribbella italica]MBB5837911.1 putative membrane protein [Kribbella italica]
MRWWNRESSRQLLSTPLAFLCVLVPGDTLVRVLAAWDFYACGYLLLTWYAYRGADAARLRAIALASRRRRLTDRLFASPPEQLSQAAAAFALIATVYAMPQARDLGVPSGLVLGICVVAVLSSWLSLQSGFAVAYVSLYAEDGGLDFPGDEEPALVDFAYFAVAVGTTFGTTDITVTKPRMRRQVLAHGVLAFLFNTLVLAVAITIITSYIAA